MSRPRYAYEHHGGTYRDVSSAGKGLERPWEWSPTSQSPTSLSPLRPIFPLPDTTSESRSSTDQSSLVLITATAEPAKAVVQKVPSNRSIWGRLARRLTRNRLAAPAPIQAPVLGPRPLILKDVSSKSEAEHKAKDKVAPHEWKEYGYWAKPSINGVFCTNSPAITERAVRTDELRDIMNSVRDPRGSNPHEYHSDAWIPGIKHPALPPRPSRWKTPIPGEPLPFPWEVQINPLLQHPRWGTAPISWCIASPPLHCAFYGSSYGAHVRLAVPDYAQPATYPFLTHMHFNAVSDDSFPSWPWAFTIVRPRGIKVGDVLEEIHKQFYKPLRSDEFASFSAIRQGSTRSALMVRQALVRESGVPEFQDEPRRVDCLGGGFYFRGIEPSIDGGGWTISFGCS